jgi:hypothetical protein
VKNIQWSDFGFHDYGPTVSEIRDLAKQKVTAFLLNAKIDHLQQAQD